MVYIVLIVLGLAFGSFVNALVWRVHELESSKKRTTKQKRELSMLHGRSMCPHCKHPLAWYDLLPVVSWLSLGGKCRYCHKPIPDSPVVEAALAGIFILSYAYWPLTFNTRGWYDFIIWLAISVGLMALLIYDLRWMLLPNKIVYPLFYLAITAAIVDVLAFHAGAHFILDVLYGFLAGGGLFWVLFQISGGKWIGGGDVRLGALLGIVVGSLSGSLLVIFLASLLGSVVAIPMLIARQAKTNTRIPFGPFLIIATIIVKLFGATLISWYRRKFLII
ncbi:MAG TPA: prepilin peptidase [Candidatus Saccharimonadales bacterium]|nr:prepilin peptidase [Candidatus Saccharimonadales bacterium]